MASPLQLGVLDTLTALSTGVQLRRGRSSYRKLKSAELRLCTVCRPGRLYTGFHTTLGYETGSEQLDQRTSKVPKAGKSTLSRRLASLRSHSIKGFQLPLIRDAILSMFDWYSARPPPPPPMLLCTGYTATRSGWLPRR